MKSDKPIVDLTDLRSVTRSANLTNTHINLFNKRTRREEPWIICGTVAIREYEPIESCWMLAARLDYGVTDFNHDSAHAIQLPLIGLTFNDMIFDGVIMFSAWVDPNAEDDFRVPDPGYDPVAMEDTYTCEDCEKPHPIIREGLYAGPRNKALYKKVRGRKISIQIAPVWDVEQEEPARWF